MIHSAQSSKNIINVGELLQKNLDKLTLFFVQKLNLATVSAYSQGLE